MKFLLTFLFFLFFIFPVFSQEKFKAKVVGVVDGDTITVMDSTGRQIVIRLAGIDAPELAQENGQTARDFLIRLVLEKKVVIEGSKLDKYGRLVAKVIVHSTDISLEMIKAGLAWHFKKYENEQSEPDRKLYADAEMLARSIKKGLWLQPNPVEPSAYRAAKQAAAQSAAVSSPPVPERIILPAPSTYVGGGPDSGGSAPNPNRPVRVRRYVRRDGTVVDSHTRSLPGRRN